MLIIDELPQTPKNDAELVTICNDPHSLLVSIIPIATAQNNQIIFDLDELRAALRHSVEAISAIWSTKFFKRWVVISGPHRAGVFGGPIFGIEFANSKAVASIILPAELFPSTANNRGRPGRAGTAEESAAIASEILFYKLSCYLRAYYKKCNPDSPSSHLADQELSKIAKSLFECYHGVGGESLFKGICERGSSELTAFLGEDSAQTIKRTLRKNARMQASVSRCKNYRSESFDDVYDLFSLVCKYRNIMIELTDARISFRRVLNETSSPKQALEIQKHADRLVDPEPELSIGDIIILAFEFDLDASEAYANRRYLRPLIQAARFLGYRKRHNVALTDGACDPIGIYGLIALANGGEALKANGYEEIVGLLGPHIDQALHVYLQGHPPDILPYLPLKTENTDL